MHKNAFLSLLGLSLIFGAQAFAARGNPLPIVAAPAEGITIDGDPSDWREWHLGVLSQEWQNVSQQKPHPKRHDVAFYQMRYGSDAFYIGVQVIDQSISNPHSLKKAHAGDCVELYFDFRPEQSEQLETYTLGEGVVTNGVYQILCVPPTEENPKPRYRVAKYAKQFQGLHFASSLTEQGYFIEISIPYSEAVPVALSRPEQPIGFALKVNDIDIIPDKLKATKNAAYALKAYPHYWKHPGTYTRAQLVGPDEPFPQGSNFWSYSVNGAEISGIAGAVFPSNQSPDLGLTLDWKYSDFDATLEQPNTPQLKQEAELKAVDFSELGVALHFKPFTFELSASGRYSLFFSELEKAKSIHSMDLYLDLLSSSLLSKDKNITLDELVKTLTTRHSLQLYPSDSYLTHNKAWKIHTRFKLLSGNIHWALSQGLEGTESLQMNVIFSDPETGKERYRHPIPLRTLSDFVPKVHTLQGSELAPGRYDLTVTLETDTHEEIPFISPQKYNAGGQIQKYEFPVFFHLIVDKDDSQRVLETAQVKLSTAPSQPVLIGNPARERYKTDSPKHSYARTASSLTHFGDRIYVGMGDSGFNQGPVDIWSFSVHSENDHDFIKEATIPEEAVRSYHNIDGKLYTPGNDPRESWALGNIYVKNKEGWEQIRTLPKVIHAYGIALHQEKLYVTTGTSPVQAGLYASTDEGQSWQWIDYEVPLNRVAQRFYSLASFQGGLLVNPLNSSRYTFFLKDDVMQYQATPMFPRLAPAAVNPIEKTISFAGGILYKPTRDPRKANDPQAPLALYFLKDFKTGPQVIDWTLDYYVSDITRAGNYCYLLCRTVSTQEGADEGRIDSEIYRTHDLKTWERVAHFTTESYPFSLEVYENQAFIGLGTPKATVAQTSGDILKLELETNSK